MSYTKISKYISLILRHKPEIIDITLDKNGWANVNKLIDGVNRKYNPFTMEMLEEIVRTDDKQRYSFNENKTKIRANQGHSINVDVELTEIKPPNILYHGTADKYLKSIMKNGLQSQSRLYVHLSQTIDTAIKVGKRHGNPVLIIVDTKAMYEDGYKFFKSQNNVYLTKEVPVEYLKI